MRFSSEELALIRRVLAQYDAPIQAGPYCKMLLLRALRELEQHGVRAAS
jgi:hypothetical protein